MFVTELQPAKIRLDRKSRKIFFIGKSFLLNKANKVLEKTCQNTQTDDEEQITRDLFGPAKILPFVFEKFQDLLREKCNQKKGKDKAKAINKDEKETGPARMAAGINEN